VFHHWEPQWLSSFSRTGGVLTKEGKKLELLLFLFPPASNGFFPKTRAAQQLRQQVNSVHHTVFWSIMRAVGTRRR
jgi:hypothetical protein